MIILHYLDKQGENSESSIHLSLDDGNYSLVVQQYANKGQSDSWDMMPRRHLYNVAGWTLPGTSVQTEIPDLAYNKTIFL